jgi:hypothetical protein
MPQVHPPQAPCPLHGPANETGCVWCGEAKFRGVHAALRGLLRIQLLTREPAARIEELEIVLVIERTLLVRADIRAGQALAVRRYLINPRAVLALD